MGEGLRAWFEPGVEVDIAMPRRRLVRYYIYLIGGRLLCTIRCPELGQIDEASCKRSGLASGNLPLLIDYGDLALARTKPSTPRPRHAQSLGRRPAMCSSYDIYKEQQEHFDPLQEVQCL